MIRVAFKLAAEFPPGSFAFVMATGIVSIAAAPIGLRRIAAILLAINIIAFPLLWLSLAMQLWRQPAMIISDLRDCRRGPALLTIVAGTCVVGSQVSLLTDYRGVAAALWIGGGILWLGLIYALFAVMTARSVKPAFASGIDGGWLLIVVASEALAILGTDAADLLPAPRAALFASFCLYLFGSLLYLMLLTLILYRWLFLPMAPGQLAPSYWINMGAAAITTLAGTDLLTKIAAAPMLIPALVPAHSFVFTETVLFWSIATWWIPLLAALTCWRHRTVPFGYRLENWSIVFPLGMYTAATWSFCDVLDLPFLKIIPRLFVWVAIAAWCLTFAMMVRQLGRLWRQRERDPSSR